MNKEKISKNKKKIKDVEWIENFKQILQNLEEGTRKKEQNEKEVILNTIEEVRDTINKEEKA